MNVVTIYIGGAHLTAAMYDGVAQCLVPETYLRASVNYKAGTSGIVNEWRSIIERVKGYNAGSFDGVAIAVPARFDPVYQSRPGNTFLDIRRQFSAFLSFPEEKISVFSGIEAFIQGELAKTSAVPDKVAVLTIGTDVNAGVFDNGTITNLHWEFETFAQGSINHLLSVQWLVNAYYKKTGLSVVNVRQLIGLAKQSATVRKILKEYKINLTEAIRQKLVTKDIRQLIIEGDILYAWKYLFPYLAEKLWPVEIKKADPDKGSFLTGAYLFYQKQLVLV